MSHLLNHRIQLSPRLAVMFLLVGLVVGLDSAAFAEELFVNNERGDDSRSGTVAENASGPNPGPVRTIARALELAGPGDRIVIQKTDTPYRESLSVQGSRLSGTRIAPLQIISDGAILDGTAPIPVDAWEVVGSDVFRFQPDLKSHQQLFLDGRPLVRVDDPQMLEPMTWALVDGWIWFRPEADQTPSSYPLSCSQLQTGITLYEVRRVEISGLVIQGFQLDGVNAHDSATDIVISRCNLRGNGRSGLSVGGASRVTLNESIAGSNFGPQIRTETVGRLAVRDCSVLVSADFGPAWASDGGRIEIAMENIKDVD